MDKVRTLALVDDDAAILDALGLFFAQNGIESSMFPMLVPCWINLLRARISTASSRISACRGCPAWIF